MSIQKERIELMLTREELSTIDYHTEVMIGLSCGRDPPTLAPGGGRRSDEVLNSSTILDLAQPDNRVHSGAIWLMAI